MGAVGLLETLNERAARNGVGRVDILENRLVGMKSRGLYETPGGTILMEAMTTMQSLVLDRDTARLVEELALRFADLVYNGKWFCPEREALEALFRKANERTTGSVEVALYKGKATSVRAESPFSLFSEELATFGEGKNYQQADSEGFVRLFGLPLRVAAEVRRGEAK